MVLTLIAVSAIMTAQIIARRFMGTSIAWSEEMCRYLFIWMGFLSISHSVRAKSIIKLDIVELLLPPAVIKPLPLPLTCLWRRCSPVSHTSPWILSAPQIRDGPVWISA